MSPKEFFTNVILTTLIALGASIFGGITAAWWSAALLGFGLALAFTMVSERLLRGKLFGKFGKEPIGWHFYHLLFQTLAMAALIWAFGAVFGVHVTGKITAAICAALIYLVNCRDQIKTYFPLLAMYLATRR